MTDERAREIEAIRQRVESNYDGVGSRYIWDAFTVKRSLDDLRFLLQALREARAQGMEEAARLLEENGRHCNAEARASIKQAAGQSTIYAEKLTREAEVCFQRAAAIRQAGQGKEGGCQ